MQQIREIDDTDDVDLCMQLLAVASSVYQPPTLEELHSLIKHPQIAGSTGWVEDIANLCGSFLTIRDRTIYFVHQSARDFLYDSNLNTEFHRVFPAGTGSVHYALFFRSIQFLCHTLRRDIYGLSHPGFPADCVTPPSPDPLAPARYSCICWADHLVDTSQRTDLRPEDLQDGGIVYQFLDNKYLNWLEALSLFGSMSEGIIAISKLDTLIVSSVLHSVLDTPYIVNTIKLTSLTGNSRDSASPPGLGCPPVHPSASFGS